MGASVDHNAVRMSLVTNSRLGILLNDSRLTSTLDASVEALYDKKCMRCESTAPVVLPKAPHFLFNIRWCVQLCMLSTDTSATAENNDIV